MKRIIDGKTYNTETATRIAEIDDDINCESDGLFQTRFGAFFLYRHGFDQQAGAWYQLIPQQPSEAQEWLEKRNFVDEIEKVFGAQPEAGESESRVTVRIPDSLKARIESLAAANKQSLNAWIMRCLETCASAQAQAR